MHQTLYHLKTLINTRTGAEYLTDCSLPMNTELMLVRTKGNRLGFKRLKRARKTRIVVPRINTDQISLL